MPNTNQNVNIVINAKDKTKSAFSGITKSLAGMAAGFAAVAIATEAFTESIKAAADFEATTQSLAAVTKSTGRDINEVYSEMEKHIGGLASKASVAQGFLKGMTTELNVKQISDMTQAVKEASIAMGEDFNVQLPMIIKAVKQLNPAILDNIGVTVRLDKINQKIRDGYFGLNKEVNEATQQNAIFNEIMKQTNKFRGQEAAFLKTAKGQWQQLSAAVSDLATNLGTVFLPIINAVLVPLVALTKLLVGDTNSLVPTMDAATSKQSKWNAELKALQTQLKSGNITLDEFRVLVSQIGKADIIPEAVNVGLVEMAAGFQQVADNAFVAIDAAKIFGATIGEYTGPLTKMEEITAEFQRSREEAIRAGEAMQAAIDKANATPVSVITLGPDLELLEEQLEEELEENKKQFAALLALRKSFADNVKQLDNERFRIQLESMTTADAAFAELRETRRLRELAVGLAGIEDQNEIDQRMREIKMAFDAGMLELDIAGNDARIEEQQRLVDDWLEKWSLIQDATLEIFDTISQTLITNTGNMAENLKKTFEDIGRQIVRTFVTLGVKKLFEWIATSVVGEKQAKKLAAAIAAQTASQSALAIATGVATVALSAQAIAAELLADALWDAVAAQAALTLGATIGPALGAAAAIVAGRQALSAGSPSTSNFIQGEISSGRAPAAGGINLTFTGPVTDGSFVRDTIVPAIEQANLDGFARFNTDDLNITGDSPIAFA